MIQAQKCFGSIGGASDKRAGSFCALEEPNDLFTSFMDAQLVAFLALQFLSLRIAARACNIL